MSTPTGDPEPLLGKVKAPDITEDNLQKKLDRIAFKLFGSYFQSKQQSYVGLRKKMNQARMEVGYDMYLSRITLYSIVTGIVGAALGVLVTGLLAVTGNLEAVSVAVSLPPGLASVVVDYQLFIVGFIFTVVAASMLAGITGGLLYYMPSYYAGERKRAINHSLPQAVTFTYALSKGGMNILEVMRNLSDAEDVYGEVSNEFDMMLRDMDYFGNDLRIALRNASEITPSENLADFLDDLLSVIDSGGAMTPFLLNKSEQYHEIRKQDQKGFLDTLALMAESYVTAFVAAPLFIIIITTIMAVMGGADMMMLYALVYLVLPIASLGFAFTLDLISTGGHAGAKQLELPYDPYDLEEIEKDAKELDDDRFKELVRAKKMQEVKDFMRDPLADIKENPLLSLAFTVPLAIILMLIVIFTGLAEPSLTALKANPWWTTVVLFFIPLMVVTVPLSVFHEIKMRKQKKIIRELPETLKKLSSANETGMTLNDSIDLVSQTSSGVLSRELRKVHNQIQWDTSLNAALIDFANRMRIPRLSRTIKLLTKANESSGDVRGVLKVAARDVDSEYKLDRERFQNMIIYTVIIIISFLVFLFVIVILDRQFLTEMAKAGGGGSGGASGGAGGGGMGFDISNVPLDTFRMLFFHAAVIQAFASGLVAGQMGENNLLSGLKYSIAMSLIALIVFMFV